MRETNKHVRKAIKINKGKIAVCLLEPRKYLDSAIAGVRVRNKIAHIVYSYSRLVKGFMKCDMDEEEAMEWIDYNTIRAIPYMRGPGQAEPIVSGYD